MSKTPIAQIPAKLHEILSPLSPDDRSRVLQATLILCGDNLQSVLPGAPAPAATPPASPPSAASSTDAGAFLDKKAPANKGEILAVAARYREQILKEQTHSKADLKKVITDARRNFDDNNFGRDLNNAKRQAGFFNLGTGRDASKLSYYGQQFVDALPDREAASKLKRPKVGGNRKNTGSKKSPTNMSSTKSRK
jgi:hypothetical protein